MNDPIQLIYLGTPVPDLTTSAYGPFVVHPVPDADELARTLGEQRCDALVMALDAGTALAMLAQRPLLSNALLDTALVVVAPEPDASDALRLLRQGAQDVLPLREANGDNVARVVRLAVERKRVDRAARKAYATDLATGLPNHAQLHEHMTHLLALREREPAAMALVAVRLEGLATTESRLGIEAANVLRRKAAVRLRAGLRASDVVASVGSDTFVVLLAWIDDAAASEGVAAKMVQSLQRPINVAGQDLALAVSAGIAQYPAHGKDADTLLRRALGQAAGLATVGPGGLGRRAERGETAAANDEI